MAFRQYECGAPLRFFEYMLYDVAMKRLARMFRFSSPIGRLVPVLLLCATLAVTAYIEDSRQRRELSQMQYIASTVSAEVYQTISQHLSRVKVLEAVLIQTGGQMEDFAAVAKRLIEEPGVRNVLFAPDGVVTEVYPLEGNEGVLGLDLKGVGAGNKEAQAAISSGEMIMAGPFDLIQGGMGIAGRLPVYIEDEDGRKDFWGIVSVTLAYPDVLRGLSLQGIAKQGFAWELWRINADTGQHQTILGSPVTGPSITEEVSIYNSQWFISIAPLKHWYAHANLWFTLGAGLLLTCLSVLAMRNFESIERMKGEAAQNQILALQRQIEFDRASIMLTQISSHFFYHTLNAIQALIVLDPASASKMAGDFSRYLRFRVDSVDAKRGLVSFREEMRSVRAYADISQVLLGDRLHIEYDVPDLDFMMPVLTVQPIVENAIMHGIRPKIGGGTVWISAKEDTAGFIVTVRDDGPGFDPTQAESTTSVGLRNIKKRMESYQNCTLDIQSGPEGTTITLRFPRRIAAI